MSVSINVSKYMITLMTDNAILVQWYYEPRCSFGAVKVP